MFSTFIEKLKPSRAWIKPALIILLFAFFFILPFILGGQRDDLPDGAADKQSSNTQHATKSPSSGPPDTFTPVIKTGPFAITQTDADRGGWSWSKAKGLSSKIWSNTSKTADYNSFYCGCDITKTSSTGGKVDLSSCGVTPRKSNVRANRLEWEHVVPASIIGRGKSCWTTGAALCRDKEGKPFKGRSCCEISDPLYNMAATDPVNLVPSVGEINGDRSNYAYGVIQGEAREYGQCDMEIDRVSKTAEPPQHVRGDIARIWAYMSRAYGITLTAEEAAMYKDWMSHDPISNSEVWINQKIRESGHRSNPFVDQVP